MAMIVVGGSGRGVGKTSLVCGLIAAMREFPWTAVKIAAHQHGVSEPVWEERAAGQGSDTARYLAAGAKQAFLLTAQDESKLPSIVEQLWPKLRQDSPVIFESNRIVHHLRPDLCLLVRRGPERADYKSSFEQAIRFADAMIEQREADRMLQRGFESGDRSGPIFYLASLECISAEMRFWVREQLAARREHNEEHRAR